MTTLIGTLATHVALATMVHDQQVEVIRAEPSPNTIHTMDSEQQRAIMAHVQSEIPQYDRNERRQYKKKERKLFRP